MSAEVENSNKIFQLEQRIAELEERPFDRFMSPTTKDQLAEVVGDSLLDIAWDKYYHYSTFFESDDGWSLSDSASGSVSGAYGGGFQLRTGAASGNESFIVKYPLYQNVLTYQKHSRFRTAFYLNENGASTTQREKADNLFGYIGTGNGYVTASSGLDDSVSQFGFYIENDKIFGTSGDGVNLSSISLKEGVVYGDLYIIECRYFPGERVDFYLSEPVTAFFATPQPNISDFTPVFAGSISTTLPNQDANQTLIRYQIRTAEANYKEMQFTMFEYIQER